MTATDIEPPYKRDATKDPQAYIFNWAPTRESCKRDGVFIPALVADAILTVEKFAHHEVTKDFYVYLPERGIWAREGAESLIEKHAEEIMGNDATVHQVKEVVGHIKRSTYYPAVWFKQNPLLLVTLNQRLILNDDGSIRDVTAHAPDPPAFRCLPVNYDAAARCPETVRHFVTVCPLDRLDALVEFFGYGLYNEYPFHKFLVLTGDGDNGKSKTLDLYTRLLGPDNVSSVKLQQIASDTYATADLYGKYANIAADLSNKAMTDAGPLKEATGGDRLRAQRKYGQPFQFYNEAKMVYSANHPPDISDHTRAMWRRVLMIEFSHTFSDQDRDNNILTRLTTPAELSGFLNLCLDGLHRLLTNQQFSYATDPEAVERDYRSRADPVHAFAVEHLIQESDPQTYVVRDEVYRAFLDFCKANKRSIHSKQWFNDRLQQTLNLSHAQRDAKGRKRWCWLGLRLRNAQDPQQSLSEDDDPTESHTSQSFLNTVCKSDDTSPRYTVHTLQQYPEIDVMSVISVPDPLVTDDSPAAISSNTREPVGYSPPLSPLDDHKHAQKLDCPIQPVTGTRPKGDPSPPTVSPSVTPPSGESGTAGYTSEGHLIPRHLQPNLGFSSQKDAIASIMVLFEEHSDLYQDDPYSAKQIAADLDLLTVSPPLLEILKHLADAGTIFPAPDCREEGGGYRY